MPRLFWANFDFEHELAEGSRWRRGETIVNYCLAQAPALLALAGPDDRVVTFASPRFHEHPPVDPRILPSLKVTVGQEYSGPDWELIPWGVAQPLQGLAQDRGWRWNQPDPALVRRLNDRTTSFAWEERTGTLPRGARCIANLDDLSAALAGLPGAEWIIKACFGMSGRERIAGRGEPTEPQRNWITKRLRQQGAVFLEPRLENLGEAGLQWDVPISGEPRLLAVLPLVSSPQGAYVEHRAPLEGAELVRWEAAIQVTSEIAREFQQLGYFGPLGIDAMCYRAGDSELIRPVQDINARWTMGRLVWESLRHSDF